MLAQFFTYCDIILNFSGFLQTGNSAPTQNHFYYFAFVSRRILLRRRQSKNICYCDEIQLGFYYIYFKLFFSEEFTHNDYAIRNKKYRKYKRQKIIPKKLMIMACNKFKPNRNINSSIYTTKLQFENINLDGQT